jgi:hypothetical protein
MAGYYPDSPRIVVFIQRFNVDQSLGSECRLCSFRDQETVAKSTEFMKPGCKYSFQIIFAMETTLVKGSLFHQNGLQRDCR